MTKRRVPEVTICQVAVDEAGRLLVQPALPPGTDFMHVYRAAMGVYWEPETRSLLAPRPREWTYFDWFRQILAAVADEYGQRLMLRPETKWMNVPPHLRTRIETWAGQAEDALAEPHEEGDR